MPCALFSVYARVGIVSKSVENLQFWVVKLAFVIFNKFKNFHILCSLRGKITICGKVPEFFRFFCEHVENSVANLLLWQNKSEKIGEYLEKNHHFDRKVRGKKGYFMGFHCFFGYFVYFTLFHSFPQRCEKSSHRGCGKVCGFCVKLIFYQGFEGF
jgi:hypothetical protein